MDVIYVIFSALAITLLVFCSHVFLVSQREKNARVNKRLDVLTRDTEEKQRAVEVVEEELNTSRQKGTGIWVRMESYLSGVLYRAAITTDLRKAVPLVFLGGLGVGAVLFILSGRIGLALLATLSVYSGLFAALKWRESKNMNLLRFQLPDVLDFMARALRAGHSFPTAVGLTSQNFADPIASEFRKMYLEVKAGQAQRVALLNLAERTNLEEFRFLVVSIILHLDIGGKLTTLMDNLANVVRERIYFKDRVKVVSAEGRLSAYMLLALVGACILVMLVKNPGHYGVLFSDDIGKKVLVFGIFELVVGAFVMLRMVRKVTL